MWKLAINRDSLSQFGFVHEDTDCCYFYEIDPDGGNVFINDNEDFFRIDMYCFETLDGENDTYIPEHIATSKDWAMERFANLGVAMWVET